MGTKKQFAAASQSNRRSIRDESGLSIKAASTERQNVPSGAPFLSSNDQARQRLETLLRFDKFKKAHGGSKAAKMVGVSVPTLWRWGRAFAARGLAGLRPKLANCGAKSKFKPIRFTAAAVRELELLSVEHGKLRAAWLQFSKSHHCSPLIARTMQRTGTVPAALADVGRVRQVQARCFVSADGRRLYVKLPGKAVIMSKLALPPGFKLLEVKQ